MQLWMTSDREEAEVEARRLRSPDDQNIQERLMTQVTNAVAQTSHTVNTADAAPESALAQFDDAIRTLGVSVSLVRRAAPTYRYRAARDCLLAASDGLRAARDLDALSGTVQRLCAHLDGVDAPAELVHVIEREDLERHRQGIAERLMVRGFAELKALPAVFAAAVGHVTWIGVPPGFERVLDDARRAAVRFRGRARPRPLLPLCIWVDSVERALLFLDVRKSRSLVSIRRAIEDVRDEANELRDLSLLRAFVKDRRGDLNRRDADELRRQLTDVLDRRGAQLADDARGLLVHRRQETMRKLELAFGEPGLG